MIVLSYLLCMFCFFFFFQAEDGIRDHCVTGVQTCALPISWGGAGGCATSAASRSCWRATSCPGFRPPRSEERRVGKECRSRWAAGHEKKKRILEGWSVELEGQTGMNAVGRVHSTHVEYDGG